MVEFTKLTTTIDHNSHRADLSSQGRSGKENQGLKIIETLMLEKLTKIIESSH